MRDEDLIGLGVRLEDRPGAPSVWKRDNPEVLQQELRDKQAAADQAKARKLQQKIAVKQKVSLPPGCSRGLGPHITTVSTSSPSTCLLDFAVAPRNP